MTFVFFFLLHIFDFLDLLDDPEEEEVAVQQAWVELAEINKEQERYAELRAIAERELESCRQRSASLEDVIFIPNQKI